MVNKHETPQASSLNATDINRRMAVARSKPKSTAKPSQQLAAGTMQRAVRYPEWIDNAVPQLQTAGVVEALITMSGTLIEPSISTFKQSLPALKAAAAERYDRRSW